MDSMDNIKNVPQKFIDSGSSFVKKLSTDSVPIQTKSFCAFPDKVSFNGQDRDECVVLLVRRSLASYFWKYLLIFFFLIAPAFLAAVISSVGLTGGSAFAIIAGGTIILWLIAITIGVDTFLKWFFSVDLITDERIIDIDFNNILYHKVSEAQLEQIQDVTHDVAGLFGSLFDYGNVYIQTASARPRIIFEKVPRARDIQDTLQDLLEMKEKGDI